MRIAFGLKAHSGWAAFVALGAADGLLQVMDRRRFELVPEEESDWAMQPYHAAEGLSPGDARAMVRRGLAVTRKEALREMRAAVQRARDARHEVAACAVLMGEPMPSWSVEEILAVHFRMHKAEGILFRDVLVRAAAGCDLEVVAIPQKLLGEHAARVLAAPAGTLLDQVAALGKSAGPPWGRDQKEAALAAMVALHEKR